MFGYVCTNMLQFHSNGERMCEAPRNAGTLYFRKMLMRHLSQKTQGKVELILNYLGVISVRGVRCPSSKNLRTVFNSNVERFQLVLTKLLSS